MTPSALRAALIVAWGILTLGCAVRERTHAPPQDDLRPSTRALTPDDFLPSGSAAHQFDLFTGDSSEPSQRLTRRRLDTSEHGAAFAIHEGERRIEYLSTGTDGSLRLHASVERDDGSLALFDPPLVVCPPTLSAGEPFASESSMRVVSDANPGRQREKGTARRTISHVGVEHVTTPAGSFDAHRVEITFLADLTFADADTLTTQWIVPGVGVVREERSRRVTVLGAQGHPKVERLEIVSVE
ncbi:MAG: hypothetical protein HRU76_08815 [Phycisphaeraceae bacterium]|nr:hypothetical protein [Phycisphaerales bacterium]QOJ17676.1 MAG: hypothetical protein HRU76_08815 [Phycisphaeraceae bacterium]